jgi:hypothetical protein
MVAGAGCYTAGSAIYASVIGVVNVLPAPEGMGAARMVEVLTLIRPLSLALSLARSLTHCLFSNLSNISNICILYRRVYSFSYNYIN